MWESHLDSDVNYNTEEEEKRGNSAVLVAQAATTNLAQKYKGRTISLGLYFVTKASMPHKTYIK